MTEKSVRTQIALGKIPIVRLSTRTTRIDPAELEKFVESRRSEPATRRGA
jgi:hypothetical protein